MRLQLDNDQEQAVLLNRRPRMGISLEIETTQNGHRTGVQWCRPRMGISLEIETRLYDICNELGL